MFNDPLPSFHLDQVNRKIHSIWASAYGSCLAAQPQNQLPTFQLNWVLFLTFKQSGHPTPTTIPDCLACLENSLHQADKGLWFL